MANKLKMVSINYTNECAKKPRCSFCYLMREKLVNKLMRKNTKRLLQETLLGFNSEVSELIKQTEQVAIAYNGLEVKKLLEIILSCAWENENLVINITTNPDFVTPQIAALFARHKVKMVALSLDSEKCKDLNSWISAAELLKKNRILVGANILVLDEMWSRLPKILKTVNPYCYQIHLLRPKFYKTKIPKDRRLTMLFLLKSQYPNLFIDQCFRFELLGIPCTRGKDFYSVNANGSISLCSFDLYRDNLQNLKECPYI